jgi:hypothetical protein
MPEHRTDHPPITAESAAAIADDRALWTEVLAIHTRDPRGFCAAPGCRNPDGSGAMSYPCPLRVVCAWARDMHRTGQW